ncbi:MAG: FAD-dependent oxidoreductase [Gammaproteobacteria bacterium]|nr:FAD-dependent oxidoreductase [Gammaproteobacteria bacterium]
MGRIAVVGSGISGLATAYYLSRKHEVHLLEKNSKLGGHTDTHSLKIDNQDLKVDTGFIVHNDRTYPKFQSLLEELNCSTSATEMSFSVKKKGLEYKGKNLNSLFAQRRNILSPAFIRMVRDILRFNSSAQKFDMDDEEKTIGEYLQEENYSNEFKDNYLLPMAAAIWSTGREPIKAFPISAFINFFQNHGLMQLSNRPKWMVIDGGSESYVRAMENKIGTVVLDCEVKAIFRTEKKIKVVAKDYLEEFDEIVLATHSDDALQILESPSDQETSILGDMKYTSNQIILHTDERVMPIRRLAWASWNYNLNASEETVSLTYYMNLLQNLSTIKPVLVTLNDPDTIDPDLVLATRNYEHPFYNKEMIRSQKRHSEISGKNRTHFVGAYWGNGFHEDGVQSALRVCKEIEASSC